MSAVRPSVPLIHAVLRFRTLAARAPSRPSSPPRSGQTALLWFAALDSAPTTTPGQGKLVAHPLLPCLLLSTSLVCPLQEGSCRESHRRGQRGRLRPPKVAGGGKDAGHVAESQSGTKHQRHSQQQHCDCVNCSSILLPCRSLPSSRLMRALLTKATLHLIELQQF